jgi:hypothetical protein
MNKSIQRILFLLLLLFGVMAATPAKSETESVDKSFSVESIGTLTVESDQGAITVETWGKHTVGVLVEKKALKQKQLDGFKINFDQKGDDIFVEGDNDWNNKISINFIIKVPQEFNLDLKTGSGSIGVGDIRGEVKVNTSGGSIRLGKINGKSLIDTSGGSITLEQGGSNVKAETSGGSIKIGPVKGKVDVDTSGGSIRIGMADDDVIANTSGGAISVEGSNGSVNISSSGGTLFVGSSGGPVKAETSGGNINILQARGFIEAKTSGGKIEAEMIIDDKNVDTHVNLESSGGSITLHIPERLAASVSATLKITRSAKRDYRIYSEYPITIIGETSSKITAKGDINGGGDKITLRTTNGDIHIKILEE